MFKLTSIKKAIYFSFAFVSLFTSHVLYAQQDFTLYNMQAVPQRMYDNPTFRPTDTTVFIGLPILSSEYFNLSNSGFKYSDLMQPDGDSIKVNIPNMLSKLGKQNFITINYHTDLISFGFPIKKNYFSFNATEKVDIRFGYTKDFMNFLWNGNGGALIGQTLSLAPSFNATHYREYGFGWSRHINDKLTLGGKIKYLYGEENITTTNTSASLYTDANDFALTGQANINVNTSGIDNNEFNFNSGKDITNYLFKKHNGGAGVDLGGTYKLNDKITLSASVIDLGFITWHDNTTNYQSNESNASFTYNGVDVNTFISSKSIQIGNVLQTTLDSIKKTFQINTLHNSYTTMLNAQVYLSGNYNVTAKSTAGILLYGQFYSTGINPALTLSFNQQVGKSFTASISYSIYNRSYTNIGLGLAHKLGPVQLYFVSDNLLGFFLPQDAKNIMFHFGINIVLVHKRPVPKKAQF